MATIECFLEINKKLIYFVYIIFLSMKMKPLVEIKIIVFDGFFIYLRDIFCLANYVAFIGLYFTLHVI